MTIGTVHDMTASLTFDRQPNPTPATAQRREEILSDPGFGRYFTDHMVTVTWTAEDGWHDAAVRPYGPFSIDPASAVLHYAQEIFEGVKAYRPVSYTHLRAHET